VLIWLVEVGGRQGEGTSEVVGEAVNLMMSIYGGSSLYIPGRS